jgi:hypothetical protein
MQMNNNKYLFATYCNESYIQYLDALVKGCKIFLPCTPIVFALDDKTLSHSQKHGYSTLPLFDLPCAPHISALYILKNCQSEYLIKIDTDCWPLRPINFDYLLTQFNAPNIAGIGDVGQMDLPYLFKGISEQNIIVNMHEVFNTFKNFAQKWIENPIIAGERFNTGAVVDIPLLYGGFALYKTNFFKNLLIPDWIHSGDIWLSINACDQNLIWKKYESFQFNRSMNNSFAFCHMAGPKSADFDKQKIINDYENYIGLVQ